MCLAQQVWGHVRGGGGGGGAPPSGPACPPFPPFSYGSVIPESNNETKKKKMILIDIGEAEDKEYTAGIYMNKQGKS